MGFKIVADSCCDLKKLTNPEIEFVSVPLRITIDGKTYTDDGSLNTVWLINEMRSARTQSLTACPSPAEYAEAMSGDDDVFVVTLSSELSGSYQSAMAGAGMKEGSGRVYVFNSESASAGETRIVEELVALIGRGLSFDEIIEAMKPFIRDMRTFFILQSLDNLIKAGRMSKLTGSIATFMQMRPIMSDDGHGSIMLHKKVRGTKNAISQLADVMAELVSAKVKEGQPVRPLAISHCNCPELALELKALLLEKCPLLKEVRISPTGGLSTFYAFDGGIVIAY